MSEQKKIGRPPVKDPRTERLHFRVTVKEKEEIKKIAKRKGLTITELILEGIKKMQ